MRVVRVRRPVQLELSELTQDSADPREAKVVRARPAVGCALQLLANQQTGGDRLVQIGEIRRKKEKEKNKKERTKEMKEKKRKRRKEEKKEEPKEKKKEVRKKKRRKKKKQVQVLIEGLQR